ncbi:MAG TPA: DUF1329 domain-containing protein [Pseudomonas sp.]|nr:DUF1329 domain-containing protein [Pseudomonas sp.]
MTRFFLPVLSLLLLCAQQSLAAVTAEEATKLKGELTPLGAERAGNADGSIPAWTGGMTTPIPGDKPGGRRSDPFQNEKPLFTINASNAAQYADKLTDGTRAMLAKYPDSYRLDVYQTHRTAAAPQWVYDNTLTNASRARIDNDVVVGAFGGIPFPIPTSGAEVMWNHLLRWRAPAARFYATAYQLTADGRAVLASEASSVQQVPYYFKDTTLEEYAKSNLYFNIRVNLTAPAIRAGEGVVGRQNLDAAKDQAWVYLVGQRRVRKLPNTCCDTPSPTMAGVMSFDELEVFSGRLDRFDWKLLGKQEKYIPYNANKLLQPTSDKDVLSAHHLNPEHVRWELHRVWVVEATLRDGQRHQAARSLYYCDEDTWTCVLGDRWDANGQLWKTTWGQVIVMPDLPGNFMFAFGFNDLLSGAAMVAGLFNEKPVHYELLERLPDVEFTPDALANDGIR